MRGEPRNDLAQSAEPHPAGPQAAPTWRMSRRNFAAAAGLIMAGMVSNVGQARAMARPPRDWSGLGGGTRCFLAGTRVKTPTGEVPVELLKAGDLVEAQHGAAKPILGVRVIPITRGGDGNWPISGLPVQLKRGALASEMPNRDLFISQNHMLLIDGILVPAGYLVNGDTIKVVEPASVEQLVYYHIELANHDVVLAESVPCETYVEAYDRSFAPIVWLGGLRSKVASRLRSAVSPLVDIRNRGDIVRDRLEDRAEELRAA